jgi:hypothetical protein
VIECGMGPEELIAGKGLAIDLGMMGESSDATLDTVSRVDGE